MVEKEEEEEEEDEEYIFVPERKQRLLNEHSQSPRMTRLVMQEAYEPTREQDREKTPLARSQSPSRRHEDISAKDIAANSAPYTPELSNSLPTEEAKQPKPKGFHTRPPEPTLKPVSDLEPEGLSRTRQSMTEDFTPRSRLELQEEEQALRVQEEAPRTMQEEVRQGRSAPFFNIQRRSLEAEAPRSNEAEELSDEEYGQTVPFVLQRKPPSGSYRLHRGGRKS